MGLLWSCQVPSCGCAPLESDRVPGGYQADLRQYKVEPKIVVAKDGTKIRIRRATTQDKQAFVEHVLDQHGTGSGMAGDVIVIHFFNSFLEDPEMVVLWAEEADTNRALGMTAVTFPAEGQSFWHSLRVAEAARGRGIAQLLFDASGAVCNDVQRPEGLSRWGIVSTNSIMVNWSTRKKLEGPHQMTRYIAHPPEVPNRADALPAGWTCRTAQPSDFDLVYSHISGLSGGFAAASTPFRGLTTLRYGSHATLDEVLVRRIIEQEDLPVDPETQSKNMFAPLVFDDKGRLSAAAIFFDAPSPQKLAGRLLFMAFADGTRQGIQVMLDVLRQHAAERKCGMVMGYLPSLPWLNDDMEASNSYKRASAAHELFFTWKNSEF